MARFLTTAEVARELSRQYGLADPLPEWKVRRLYESGDLPEPPKFANRRMIDDTELVLIAATLQSRGWLPEAEEAVAS